MARDLRVQKTYAALMTAFEDLMALKRFDEITVAELCDRATVRRATFYKHFADKYEFFSFYVSELEARFEQEHGQKDEDARSFFMSRITYLVDFMEAHHDMVTSVSHSSLMPAMLDILADHVAKNSERKMSELGRHVRADVDPSLVSTAYAEAVVGTIKWWYLGEKRMGKQEFLRQAGELIGSIVPA